MAVPTPSLPTVHELDLVATPEHETAWFATHAHLITPRRDGLTFTPGTPAGHNGARAPRAEAQFIGGHARGVPRHAGPMRTALRGHGVRLQCQSR